MMAIEDMKQYHRTSEESWYQHWTRIFETITNQIKEVYGDRENRKLGFKSAHQSLLVIITATISIRPMKLYHRSSEEGSYHLMTIDF